MKDILAKGVWSKSEYYDIAHEGSLDFNHPAMKVLSRLARNAKIILDMGCGEGTRLNKLTGENQKAYGVDINSKAITLATKRYPKLHARVANLKNLPYKNETFDLVYSAFVFEHLDNPEKVIQEGMRVLKNSGKFLIVAPNFGAPNRASPPFKGNRYLKLLRGFIEDFFPADNIGWNKVKPIASVRSYKIDWDTTVEPYLGSLIRCMKKIGFNIVLTSSLWEKEEGKVSLMQKIFRFLGEKGIYPFVYWGPHLLVVAQK